MSSGGLAVNGSPTSVPASAEISEMSIQPPAITSGVVPGAIGTVTLRNAAPQGGVSVALATNAGGVLKQLPLTLEVPAGATTAFFEVEANEVAQPTIVTVTATLNGTTRAASLTAMPPVPLPAPGTSPGDAIVKAAGSVQPAPAQPPEPIVVEVRGLPAVDDGKLPAECPSSLRAAILTMMPAFPLIASIVIITVYIAPQGSGLLEPLPWLKANPLMSGTGFALLLTLGAALVHHHLFRGTAADNANTGAYSQICQRLRELDARLAVVSTRSEMSPAEQSAYIRARVDRDLVRQELLKKGSRWALGTGYINLWTIVHRAEEALLAVEPVSDVVSAALYDELRLQDSAMDSSPQLLAKLRLAVARLDPDSVAYLSQPPPTSPTHTVAAAESSVTNVPAAARAVLRDVRATVNEFRDSSWDAMVRTRNHLLGTLTVTGVVTYLVLLVAISGRGTDTPQDLLSDTIAAAASFYLVGAVVGLLNRLYSESQSDSAVEDYGLTTARLGLTPVLSGLAALGGVLIIAILPATVSGDFIVPSRPTIVATTATPPAGTPQATASAATSPQVQANAGPAAPRPAPRLEDIYSLRWNPFGIVLAAIFGLAPSLLLGALQNAADRYRQGLTSTSAPAQAKA